MLLILFVFFVAMTPRVFFASNIFFLPTLQDRRKDSWPNQMKDILDRAGLGNCWNEGNEIGGMVGTVSRLVATRLESQEIQI